MMNLDSFSAKKEELLANISNAVSANDAEAMKESNSSLFCFVMFAIICSNSKIQK